MRWVLSPSQLPDAPDRLSRREEFVYYFLLWCQVYGQDVPPDKQLAHEFGYTAGSFRQALHKLRDLDLMATKCKRRQIINRRPACPALSPSTTAGTR